MTNDELAMQAFTLWALNEHGMLSDDEVEKIISELSESSFLFKALKKKIEVFRINDHVKIPDLAIALCAIIGNGPAFSQIFLGEIITKRSNNDRIVTSDVSNIWPTEFPKPSDAKYDKYYEGLKKHNGAFEYNLLDTVDWWNDRINKVDMAFEK